MKFYISSHLAYIIIYHNCIQKKTKINKLIELLERFQKKQVFSLKNLLIIHITFL